MSSRPPRRWASLLAALTVPALALLSWGAPASASPAEGPAAQPSASECLPGGSSARTGGRGPDGSTYSLSQLRRIDRHLTETLDGQRLSTARTGMVLIGPELRIPVHVHVIRDGENRGPSETRVRRQLDVLDAAYNGAQSELSAPTRFSFRLASFERIRNDRWYHAGMDSRADRNMRRELHRGDASELNLYILSPQTDDRGVVLGWSSAPWQVKDDLALDGVTVHEDSLPGGGLMFYDRGDTAVHEIGHWLGLLHTFEGGCSEPNDLVADTPAEAEPSTTCDAEKDTCSLEGTDPVHNFMDYAEDACMDMFTPGQVSRMTDNWLAYRTP
jgi:Pregnancy-associated plasma protein-A